MLSKYLREAVILLFVFLMHRCIYANNKHSVNKSLYFGIFKRFWVQLFQFQAQTTKNKTLLNNFTTHLLHYNTVEILSTATLGYNKTGHCREVAIL